MTIAQVCELSEEVRTGELLTTVFLDNVYRDTHSKEADGAFVLRVTYPTTTVRALVQQISDKLSGKVQKGGLVVRGSYGAGKSHTLLVLYHLCKDVHYGKEWLKRSDIPAEFPEGVRVAAVQLLAERPDTLWEPLLERLGTTDLVGKIRDYPTREQWAELGKVPTVLIVDEVEHWYEGLDERSKVLQRNALQNLLEAAELPIPLAVVLSVYGTNDELMGVVNRTQPPVLDVGTAEDRWKIVRHRLIEGWDEEKAREVIGQYVSTYEKVQGMLPALRALGDLRAEMERTYPFHPHFLHKAFEVYGAMPRHELTRGIVAVCATLLRTKAGSRDLILMGDLDPTDEEIASDLRKLDPELVQDTVEDIRERCGDVENAKEVLATVLLHSFSPRAPGATEEDIYLGCLRPSLNINKLRSALRTVWDRALFLDRVDERYLIVKEVPLEKLIEQRARAMLGQAEGREKAANRIKQVLRDSMDGMAVLYPDEEVKGATGTGLQYVVSLEPIQEKSEEVAQLMPDNTVVLLSPLPTVRGKVTSQGEWLLQAARILVCEELLRQKTKRQADVRRIKDRHVRGLQELVGRHYARWLRLARTNELGMEPNFVVRPVSCSLSLKDVETKLRETYDENAFQDDIAKLLRHQGKQAQKGSEQTGLTVRQIREGLRREKGLSMLGGPTDEVFERALLDMVYKSVVVQVGRMPYGHDEEMKLPTPIRDDWRVWLKPYAPEPPAKPDVKERVRAKLAQAKGKGISVEDLRRYVVSELGVKAEEVRRAVQELVNTREVVLERDGERYPDDGYLPIDKVRDEALVWLSDDAPPDDRKARKEIIALVKQAGEEGITWGQVKAHLEAGGVEETAFERAIDRLLKENELTSGTIHEVSLLTDTTVLHLPFRGPSPEEVRPLRVDVPPYRLPDNAELFLGELRSRIPEDARIDKVIFKVRPADSEDPIFGSDEQVVQLALCRTHHELEWQFRHPVSKESLMNLVVRTVERLGEKGSLTIEVHIDAEVSG